MLPTLLHPTYSAARVQLPRRAVNPSLFIAALATSRNMSTISDVIKHDHRELEEFYNNILKATSSDEKIRWQNQFTWELARHSIGEEIVVYPVLEKQVSGGKDLADKDRAEHNKVRSPLFPGGTDRGSGRCSYDTFRLRSFSRSSRIRNPQTPTSTPRS